jgi:hypothetical protein
MGAVYKARQAKIERLVALKVLGFDALDHPAFAERFRRVVEQELDRIVTRSVIVWRGRGGGGGNTHGVLAALQMSARITIATLTCALLAASALSVLPVRAEALLLAQSDDAVGGFLRSRRLNDVSNLGRFERLGDERIKRQQRGARGAGRPACRA